MNAAKALGITIPQSIRLRATEVIVGQGDAGDHGVAQAGRPRSVMKTGPVAAARLAALTPRVKSRLE